ncbi:E3 ubiquitin-protein ligase MARCH2 [Fasciolopsis buskii]|uniref:E3 ubiquitin-protein ligase MARCH2 n=1 Tax=Fasciolopsis buskii TaxID=27845 RepID=A0A8E0VEM3_9TREM|nr:E3 ubiquitin-protein ligase MARCH2 [Fasciolopsis buski]
MSQSPSFRTVSSLIGGYKKKQLNSLNATNDAYFLDSSLPSRSPNRKTFLLNTSYRQVLNAPRPSLELNDENVLFANRRLLEKKIKHWRTADNIFLNNATFDSSAVHSTPTEHSSLFNPIRVSLANVHRTSTPHIRLLSRQTGKEDLFNSALIGAPRLALNQSYSSNPEVEETASKSTQIDYVVSSLDAKPVPEGQSQTQPPASPPIEPRHMLPVEVGKKQMKKSPNNTTMSDGPFRCRICLEEGDPERVLLSPCRCKGTVGLIHRQCLQLWLLESGKVNCELCGYAYIMTRSRRRSALGFSQTFVRRTGYFRDWIHLRSTRRHLLTDLICLILLTPSTYLGVYFCAVGAKNYSVENTLDWKFVGLWSLAVLLMTLFNLWVLLAIRHHWNNYKNYRCLQRRQATEEMRRLAALPRWRFSIQPRPRGSSIYLHSGTEPSARMTEPTSSAIQSDSTREFPSYIDSELEVHAQVIPAVLSSQRTQSTNQQTVVSVALSAVPEVTEEYTPSNTDKTDENTV